MSTSIEIKPGEHGVVRVFAVNLPKDQIKDFDPATALGAEQLAPALVEIFDVADLTGLGLARYLEEGHGIPPGQLADMASQLDELTGPVLILPSRALGGVRQTLTPAAPLRLVGTFFEDTQPVQFDPLPAGAATGTLAGPGAAQSPGRTRNWWVPLLIVVALLAAGLVLFGALG